MTIFTITFTDTLSGRQIYAISMEAESRAQAVDKAYRVAGAMRITLDRHARHSVTGGQA